MLGDYPRVLATVAQTHRRLTSEELEGCRGRGVRAAERGVPLGELISRHLSETWRLWPELTAVRRAAHVAVLRSTARAVLRAADDAVAQLTEGYERARRTAIRSEEARRREFIDDLLGGRGNVELLIERAERFGLQLAGSHAVAVARGPEPLSDASPLTQRVESAVISRFGTRDVLVATKDGLLVCVVPAAEGTVRPLTELLQRTLGERVGVGRAHPGPGGIVHSYEEAREALDLAARLGLGEEVVEASSLLVYRVLLRDRGAIAELVAETLGPLKRARGGPEPLLATLESYFGTGGVAAAAARYLQVGVRTVTYRLQRVRELTGYDAADPAHRFTLEAAVLGARLLNWPHQPLPAARTWSAD